VTCNLSHLPLFGQPFSVTQPLFPAQMGFQEDVETIMTSIPKEGRMTNLWSATVPAWVKDLAKKYCRKV